MTNTQNIYSNKEEYKKLYTNHSLNIVAKGEDGVSTVNINSGRIKPRIRKNSDGTTSFNYNRIGTVWHYNYADVVDAAGQQRIRETTHTQPFIVNRRAYNGGNPTTPIPKALVKEETPKKEEKRATKVETRVEDKITVLNLEKTRPRMNVP